MRGRLLVTWLAISVASGGAIAGLHLTRDPLDDPDPARQRTGYLIDGPALADMGVAASSRPTIVFFTRANRARPLVHALEKAQPIPEGAAVAVVVGEVAPDALDSFVRPGSIRLVPDSDMRIARGFGMRQPRDGGYPVGYAIVGSDGRLRYRTLDPDPVHDLFEVEIMLAAL